MSEKRLKKENDFLHKKIQEIFKDNESIKLELLSLSGYHLDPSLMKKIVIALNKSIAISAQVPGYNIFCEINKERKKAVCALIFNSDGDVLSVSRKDDFNDFGLPGGKVECDETYEQALVRECMEETGLKIYVSPVYYEEVCGDYIVRTYICTCVNFNSTQFNTDESGIVKFNQPSVLIKGSFGEYNNKLFNYFNVKVN